MSVDIPNSNFPRVVIIGGGFGGIQFAKKLKNKEVQVIMIDKHNYHTFQPLLYQVATGGLEPDSIAFPLRKIFKEQKNFIFRVAKAKRIIPERKAIETTIGEITYDYLVLATGSTTNFFGNTEIETNSMPMKSIPEALNLRSLILQSFEEALLKDSISEQEALMNFVIVGGGPTGVETAGALAELKTHVLPNDYPDLDLRRMQINLVENSPRLLSAMTEQASKKSEDFLKEMGVQVRVNDAVTSYDGRIAKLKSGKDLETTNLIWTAGVKGAVIEGLDPSLLVRGNRIKVDEFNRIVGHQNIFAIGDIAGMITDETPNGHPGVAQVAIQQAVMLGHNIIRLINNRTMTPFRYKDLGSMATVGRNKAVVDLPFIRFQGIFAWFVWMFVHLLTLVGFRNKMVVFVNWVWNYFSYDRGTRLIIRPYLKNKRIIEEEETTPVN
jgi:NADH:ubiquinone reductase (H+-translocating)